MILLVLIQRFVMDLALIDKGVVLALGGGMGVLIFGAVAIMIAIFCLLKKFGM